MRGFGRYFVLNQEHARAAAQQSASKEMKDASREVTDRRTERRDRDQPVRKAERPAARPSVVETFDLRPSRPMTADAWSLLLPKGPAPGESEAHYIYRRQVLGRQIREKAAATAKEADAIPRVMRTETDPVRRNKEIQAILDRRAAEAEVRQGRAVKSKDAGKGVEIGDD